MFLALKTAKGILPRFSKKQLEKQQQMNFPRVNRDPQLL